MLLHLSLQNVILVEKLDLDLEAGMTALTGETGAGKSVLIDALEWVLGERANASIIRQGAERADISASFQLSPAARDWLKTQEIESDDDVVLRRTLTVERSRYFINGVVATAQQMRGLGELLVNVHGQNQHQYLMKRDHQRNLLDHYGNHFTALAQVKSAYEAWNQVQKSLKILRDNPLELNNKLDFLRYQLTELEEIDLQTGELEKLEQLHKQLTHADSLRLSVEQVLQLIGEAETVNALESIEKAQHELQGSVKFSTELQSPLDCLGQAAIYCKEGYEQLRDFLNHLEIDPERLVEVEQRLQKIYDIARKHHINPEELPPLQAKFRQELNELENLQANADQLEQNLAASLAAYQLAAKQLTKHRQQAAKKFSADISQAMQTLGMKGGQFDVAFEAMDAPSAHGAERIEFLVSPNPGQPLAPLNKVASGGELSRISLAIEMLTAERDSTPTLIFDEVDVGIGGATAEMVGKLLRELGKKTQVICITHLAQVAAQAQHQIQVQKNTDGATTITSMTVLDKNERILEIARMIGGTTITEQTRSYAEEMLQAAHKA